MNYYGKDHIHKPKKGKGSYTRRAEDIDTNQSGSAFFRGEPITFDQQEAMIRSGHGGFGGG